MKVLLRSTFKAGPSDDPDLFLRNAQSLRDSGYTFDIAEDGAIWTCVQDFVQQYHHVPDGATLREHFAKVQQLTVLDRLETLMVEKPRTQGDYLKMLDQVMEDVRLRKTGDILREAAEIAQTGVTIKVGRLEKILKGPIEALRYVVDRASEVVAPMTGQHLSGQVNADGDLFQREYERVEQDPLAGIGQLTGIEQMDLVLKGAKRKELWTHAAFTGGLKSTLALNWLYNQAVYYRHSCCIFSLEMPYEQVRRILYAIHSSHPKFKDIRLKLGIKQCLDYEKIRDGELSPAEREFLFDHVVPDFNDPANKYGGIHVEVHDPDKSEFTVSDLRAKLELLWAKDPAVRMVIVDHAGLMQARQAHSSTTERLNEVLRDLKRLAMSFNRGMGIAVIALFQISREGFKSAEKTGGKYALHHLSYANEAERSSDIVTASWVDDALRESSMVKFQCLKARDTALFKDFYSGVLWACRRIYTTKDMTPEAASQTGAEIDLECA